MPLVFGLASFGMKIDSGTSATSTWQSAVGESSSSARGNLEATEKELAETLLNGGRVVATKKAAPKKAAPKKAAPKKAAAKAAPAKAAPAKKAPAKKK